VRSERERREYFWGYLLVGVVKVLLAGALLVAAVQSYLLVRQRAPAEVRGPVLLIPVLLALAGLAAGVSGWKALRAARETRRAPVERGDSEER
jgi:hypothetical protein